MSIFDSERGYHSITRDLLKDVVSCLSIILIVRLQQLPQTTLFKSICVREVLMLWRSILVQLGNSIQNEYCGLHNLHHVIWCKLSQLIKWHLGIYVTTIHANVIVRTNATVYILINLYIRIPSDKSSDIFADRFGNQIFLIPYPLHPRILMLICASISLMKYENDQIQAITSITSPVVFS